ncbi:MAG: ABC transporter permease, partial [Gemmatimonadaceae bacterium]
MRNSLEGLRRSARSLRKQPVFTTVVILSLALAIALNTTMYGVLDAMIHPRLDIRAPDQLYWIRFYGDFKYTVDNRARDAALASGMHGYSAITSTGNGIGSGPLTLIEHGANVVQGSIDGVGANYFDVIGPRIIAGRTFVPADAEPGNSPLVLGEVAAEKLFPKVQSAIGASINVDGVPHVVVGVVSAESDFPHSKSLGWSVAPYRTRGTYTRLIRLRDGVTPQAVDAELQVIAARIAAISGESTRDVAFRFSKAADPEFQARPLHYALVFAVCAVLLVACANLANLQLARGISRRRDLALRAALGATRGRIVRHLLAESVLLAAAGLGLGLAFTYLGGRVLAASIPPSMGDYVMQPHMSWRVLVFALLATGICLVLIGLAPAVYVSKADPNELLKAGAGTGATKRNRRRYGLLVGVEIAFALALASAAALSVRQAMAANRTNVGFDPSHLVEGYVASSARNGAAMHYSDVLQGLASRVKAVPGVLEATATATRGVQNGAITISDAGGTREFVTGPYGVTLVSPSYIRTYGFQVARGRDFMEGERDAGAVILDEHTAQILWPNAEAVGQQIKFGDLKSDLPYVKVVGVLSEPKAFASDSTVGVFMRNVHSLGRMLYLPGPTDSIAVDRGFGVDFIARGAKEPHALVTVLRQSFQLHGDVFARRILPMEDILGITRIRQGADFISALFTL